MSPVATSGGGGVSTDVVYTAGVLGGVPGVAGVPGSVQGTRTTPGGASAYTGVIKARLGQGRGKYSAGTVLEPVPEQCQNQYQDRHPPPTTRPPEHPTSATPAPQCIPGTLLLSAGPFCNYSCYIQSLA